MSDEIKETPKVIRRRGGPSAFSGLQDNPTASEASDYIFGSSKSSKALRAKPTDIYKIQPDPLQPRRAIPSDLRSSWNGNPHTVNDLFDKWLKAIKKERGGRELNYTDILESNDTFRGTEAETQKDENSPETIMPRSGTLEANFMRLVELAASLKRDSLTNPITVAKNGDFFIIETGERRWLAYHLLRREYGNDPWGDIPAREVKELSIWRQASENNARDDLNAISKTRQLALLLMALHGWDKFQANTEFEHEREFYAQVADGFKWSIPRGKGEQVINAMGLQTGSHLRRYRALLRVDNVLWDEADDNNWTERETRDKFKAAKDLRKRRDQGHTTQEKSIAPPTDEYLAQRKSLQKTVSDIAKIAQIARVGKMNATQRVDATNNIRTLRHWLNEQEKLITGN